MINIYGIQAAQSAMIRGVAALKPSGALGRLIKEVTTRAHRYAASITHVDTGALKGSHTIEARGLHGSVYINPGATRSDGRRPAEYGPYEHARGGAHAFYARTVNEAGQRIVQQSLRVLTKELP
jgi:hypothetical protein